MVAQQRNTAQRTRKSLTGRLRVWSAAMASSHSLGAGPWIREGSGNSEFRIGRRKTSVAQRSRRPIVNCEVPDPGVPRCGIESRTSAEKNSDDSDNGGGEDDVTCYQRGSGTSQFTIGRNEVVSEFHIALGQF